MITMGIDSGSAMTKAALFDGEKIIACRMEPSGTNPGRVMRRLYEEMKTEDTAFVVATGYGRELLDEADKVITEITCHGAGAAFLCPGCDTVIDIGGQDSKVILLNEAGQVCDFLMNDKCAAGTGRFLEMTMARVGNAAGRYRPWLHPLHLPPHGGLRAKARAAEAACLLLRRSRPVGDDPRLACAVSRHAGRADPSTQPVQRCHRRGGARLPQGKQSIAFKSIK